MTTSHSFEDFFRKVQEDRGIQVNEPSEVITPLDLGEGSVDLDTSALDKEAGIPALTPIMSTVDGFRSIDWTQVRRQLRAGVNNVGVVIAVISEKTHQLGVYLAEV